jgi:predicted unusual protein kinase regulating ubiquinone biosynthesis (AarF/ABC1/UbiB family)
VTKTFRKHFGKTPNELFDSFSSEAINAASIGQVHKATKDGKELAVKIQYPGVADSVKSDLRLVKPFAIRMFDLQGKDLDRYFDEVEGKLLEETDYELELKRSQHITKECSHLRGVVFPTYYPKFSGPRVLTMDWIHGTHLSDFVKNDHPQEVRDAIGQSLWDFFLYQMHKLKMVHADPHPGNFLVTKENQLGVIDFGCVKEIPESFYESFFALTFKENLEDSEKLEDYLTKLEILTPKDTKEEHDFFKASFGEVLGKLAAPFENDTFDFGNDQYFDEIFEIGERIGREAEKRKFNPSRGSQHFL